MIHILSKHRKIKRDGDEEEWSTYITHENMQNAELVALECDYDTYKILKNRNGSNGQIVSGFVLQMMIVDYMDNRAELIHRSK